MLHRGLRCPLTTTTVPKHRLTETPTYCWLQKHRRLRNRTAAVSCMSQLPTLSDPSEIAPTYPGTYSSCHPPTSQGTPHSHHAVPRRTLPKAVAHRQKKRGRVNLLSLLRDSRLSILLLQSSTECWRWCTSVLSLHPGPGGRRYRHCPACRSAEHR